MEVDLALDTNAYTGLLAGDVSIVRQVAAATKVHLPVIVLGELRAGFARGRYQAENLSRLETFLSSPKVHVVNIDPGTTEHYAAIYAQLRQQGTPIPVNDLWIAAIVIQHQLLLCTQDKHFDHIPQIRRC